MADVIYNAIVKYNFSALSTNRLYEKLYSKWYQLMPYSVLCLLYNFLKFNIGTKLG